MNYTYAVAGIKKGSVNYANFKLKLLTDSGFDKFIKSIQDDIKNPGGAGAIMSVLDEEYPNSVATIETTNAFYKVVPLT